MSRFEALNAPTRHRGEICRLTDPGSWRDFDVDAADSLAADIVCRWHETVDFDPVVDGIDYSVVLRQHLWHLVARYIRMHRGFSETRPAVSSRFSESFRIANSTANRSVRSARRTALWLAQALSNIRRSSKCPLFVPFPHARWDNVWRSMRQTKRRIVTESPVRYALGTRAIAGEDFEFATEVVGWLTTALAQWFIIPGQASIDNLVQNVARSRCIIRFATLSLQRHRVRRLVVNSSATSPTIEYVLAARAAGIPSCAIQYGLDCDRLVYDDLHTDTAAVWSEKRREQYLLRSSRVSREIVVTGNPEYDSLQLASSRGRHSVWLWLTRPHTAMKCKLPSAEPDEGLKILLALIAALSKYPDARLIIKPHPSDNVSSYADMIADHSLKHRISICTQPLATVIQQAGVVITEDTTAGLDALFYQPACIHVRFSKTSPVMPLSEYGAAISANGNEELIDALGAIQEEQVVMEQRSGQREFLRAYAGSIDGNSCMRLSTCLMRG